MADPLSLCIIIPTLNSASGLSALLTQLRGPTENQHVSDLTTHIVISDGLSSDATVQVAAAHNLSVAMGTSGRGAQLRRGVRWADMTAVCSAPWYLMLHADTQLPPTWRDDVRTHMRRRPKSVGYFRYGADTPKFWGRFMEFWVGMRCFWWGLPYGDQGLLISKSMYDAIGGYRDMDLFEDVNLVDRLKTKFGRRVLRPLRGKIVTDVSAYARTGWWARGRRNMKLVKAYRQGTPVETLLQRYQ